MGKKNAIVMTVLVIFSIVLFNVLTPYGQALFSIGAFTITKGAILTGIKRGVTLEGLVMLSKASVREDLHLPGGFGAIIGESFRIFALIMEQKQRIRPKTILADLDALLLELDSTAYGIGSGQHEQSAALGIIVLIAAVCLSWGIFCGGLFFKW
jgi:heptaprenyl diphosphate synthase